MIAPAPVDGKPLSHADFDPVWGACSDEGVAPVFHVSEFESPLHPAWRTGEHEDGEQLFDNLRNLSTHNAQGEYYLTDLLGLLRDAGMGVGAVIADDPIEALGVNSRADLASVEGEIQRRVIAKLMSEGVTFRNPATVVMDSTVAIGNDTVVYPFVTIEGKTTIGSRCVIEPGVHLTDVTAGNDVHLKTGTVAELPISAGASVASGDTLAVISSDGAASE